MIPANLYQTLYLFLVLISTLVSYRNKRLPYEKENSLGGVFLCIFMILFIGLRPVSYEFVDMMNYANWWKNTPVWNGFDYYAENMIFDNLYYYMSSQSMPIWIFFLIIAAIYFICMYVSCKKMFPNHVYLAFLVCLGAFSTFSYGTNGIKAGAAASLFLVALAYRDKKIISIIFVFVSWGFHHSMQLPVIAYVISLFFKKKEWYFGGWVFCLLMALAHVTVFQNIFAGFTDESGNDYLSTVNSGWGGRTGFRIDFVMYSAMPVIMGYYVKYRYKLNDFIYDNLLNVYLTCNGVWMLCMYASFTNRIAYLSWFMYPIVLIYPCFKINDINHPLVRNRNKIILLHLGFTLFMSFIYYA